MKTFRTLVTLLLLGIGLSAFAQRTVCLPSRPGPEPFCAGEKIVFNISYDWNAVRTDVARGTLTMGQESLNGEKVWHSSLSMKTAPFFDVFFKIREKFDSWFALEGVEPRKFLRDSREGDYHAVNDYVYDRKAGLIHAKLAYRDQPMTFQDIPYGDCTYDVTTLFFFARRMDFEKMAPGTVHKISIAIDADVLHMNLTYRGREKKYIRGLGTVSTFKVGIALKKGDVFEGNEDALVWFSADDNRMPVAFMAPLKVGAMNGRAASFSGLAHPFTALISTKKVK